MPELRKDPVVGRWVIISTERPPWPSDFAPAPATRPVSGVCVFCPGQETRTPAGDPRPPPRGHQAQHAGWTMRVVPNKFPAPRIEGELGRPARASTTA